jgi:Peptide methionine sulfoxide reductase
MNRRLALSLLLLIPTLASCEPEKVMTEQDKQAAKVPEVPAGAETITLGAGCFWCVEAAYKQVDGVISATSGYMGGTKKNPTYEDICSGSSGHAEVVQVVFDPNKIALEKVLAWFWDLHDPTTLRNKLKLLRPPKPQPRRISKTQSSPESTRRRRSIQQKTTTKTSTRRTNQRTRIVGLSSNRS